MRPKSIFPDRECRPVRPPGQAGFGASPWRAATAMRLDDCVIADGTPSCVHETLFPENPASPGRVSRRRDGRLR